MTEELIHAKETLSPDRAQKYEVSLPSWSGPYDLLLKVIEEQNLNLLDLNISILLEHYVHYLEALSVVDIDEAGEFLLVAATLAQIKSKLLLPKEEAPEEEEIDPRADLVRYLQEYQRIKKAALDLGERPLLGRDVFAKGANEYFEGLESEGTGKMFQLVKGFQTALREAKALKGISFSLEDVNVGDRMKEIFEQLKGLQEMRFDDLIRSSRSKTFMIASFLAVLELVRQKHLLLFQAEENSPLFLQWNTASTEVLGEISEFDLPAPNSDNASVEINPEVRED